MTAIADRIQLPRRLPRITLPPGISAIIVKELRGRMRGRRAFIVLTIHVLLLAVFAWMFERLDEQNIAQQVAFGGQATYASASIGRGIFFGLMELQTLMVAVLAPAATAGAISSEREHQTLDLLTVTPISSIAIVLGKLLSALAWIFVLILASIPVTALVFVFGGVAPDDLLRAYAVLFATVVGLGSVGIFFSTLTRRTGASTGLTFVVTLVLVIGSLFIWVFLYGTSEVSPNGVRKQPPEAILYLNPFIAQADVACGTEAGGFGGSCSVITGILGAPETITSPDVFPGKPVPAILPAPGTGLGGAGRNFAIVDGIGVAGKGGVSMPADVGPNQIAGDQVINAADPFRDRFWPKSVLSFLVLAVVMTVLSVQLVSPTRRWRPGVPGRVRRPFRGRPKP